MLLIALAFPVFFGALWFGIVGFLAWAGGWRALSKAYAAVLPETFEGRKLSTVTVGRGRFPRVHYRSVLWASFEEDRLLLKPHLLFRWAHPPLAIPRKSLSARERKGILRRFCEVRAAAVPGISIHMPTRHYGWTEDVVKLGGGATPGP